MGRLCDEIVANYNSMAGFTNNGFCYYCNIKCLSYG